MIESLDDLKGAVDDWRSKKRYAAEAMPEDLLQRARRAAATHGVARVVRATKIDRARLKGRRGHASRGDRRGKPTVEAVPAFSRLELARPHSSTDPIAEVETPSGLKLRVFAQTRETVGLLTLLCGVGAMP